MRIEASMRTAKVTNISGMSGMMCSGRIFALPELPAKSNDKGKAREDVVEREKQRSICYRKNQNVNTNGFE